MTKKIIDKKVVDHHVKLIKEEIDPRSYDKKKVAKNVTNNVLWSLPGIGTFYGIYIAIHNGKKKEVVKKQADRADKLEKKKRKMGGVK